MGGSFVKSQHSKAFGVTTRNKVLKWCVFVFYADQAVPVVTQVVMVKSPIAVAYMARLVVAGTASRRLNAPLMAILTCLLLTYNISQNSTTLLIAMFMMVEPIFAVRVVTLTMRAYFDTDFVVTLKLPVYFVRFSAVVIMFRVGHNSLESDESTLSGDK